MLHYCDCLIAKSVLPSEKVNGELNRPSIRLFTSSETFSTRSSTTRSSLIGKMMFMGRYLLAGPIVDGGELNPLYLSVATKGYRIQSRTLRIPDRYGFFVSGPPRPQAHEGEFFFMAIFFILLTLIGNVLSYLSCVTLCKPLVCDYCWQFVPFYLFGMTIPGTGLL